MTEVGELITPTGVLVMSAEQMNNDREGWLSARRHDPNKPRSYRIGSSEVPSILDLDGVDTPVHVYRNKVHGVKTPVNEAMQWGHIFEPAIAGEWQRRNRTAVDEIGLVRHVDTPWHQSTIDRRVLECPLGAERHPRCGLEVKNVGYSSSSRWGRDLPDRILAQIVHQIYVTGYDHMHYACNIGGNMMKQGVVYRDREQQLMDYIIGQVNIFRTKHLLAGVEPDWSDSKPAKMLALDKATHPTRVGEATIDDMGWVYEYAQASAEEGAAKKRKDKAKVHLAELANGVEAVQFSGELAYLYRPGSKLTANLDRLKEKYPDAYDDPEIVRESNYHTIQIAREYRVKIQEDKA